MKTLVSLLKKLIPVSIRRLPLVQRCKNAFNEKVLGHDGVYDQSYYQKTVETPAVQSAPHIVDSVISSWKPSSLIDVGCGTGALMEAARGRGVKVKGLEYSEAGLEFCRKRQLEVAKFDLEKDSLQHQERFDVAVSMEVAEHLPEKVADRYVALLAGVSDHIVFTAAPPGQGGQDHVNEQPPSYWITKFAAHGLQFEDALTTRWKREWERGKVASWYCQNLLLFSRTLTPVSK